MSPGLNPNVPLLRVKDLRVHFQPRGRLFCPPRPPLRAVDGVTFELYPGRTLGLVGESGCGKSTLARTILRLVPATSGHVWLDGVDLLGLSRRALRPIRRRMQIVFQDPLSSLNPRLTVETLVGEALRVHGVVRGRHACRQRVAEWLARVGLSPADLGRYPHEFSGGQRQRICIARALALQPSLVLCDEPVSALDVSIQAQILNLLADLQAELGVSYLFISHNLAVVQHVSDDLAVMYLGRIVEHGPAVEVLASPGHPYTQALRAAQPGLDRESASARTALPVLDSEPPNPLTPPGGCSFSPRCPRAEARCHVEAPELETRPGLMTLHRVACHFSAQAAHPRSPDPTLP